MSTNQNAIINIQIVNPYQEGFTIICHCLLQWGALNLSYDIFQFSRASKKHQFSTKTITTKTNSTFIS